MFLRISRTGLAASSAGLLLSALATTTALATTSIVIDARGGADAPLPVGAPVFETMANGWVSSGELSVELPAQWGGGHAIRVAADDRRDEVVLHAAAFVQRDEAGAAVREAMPRVAPGDATGSTVRYADVLPGIDDEYTLATDGRSLKYDAVLRDVGVVDRRAASFGRAVNLALPAGWALVDCPVDASALRIVDAHGDDRFMLPTVVAYDASGASVTGHFLVEPTGSAAAPNWRVEMSVPARWLRTAEYPVRLDPTISVPAIHTLNSIPWGSSGFFSPLYQQSYTTTDMQSTAGDITEFGIQLEWVNTTVNFTNLKITLGETSRDGMTANPGAPATNFDIGTPVVVYDAPVNEMTDASGFLMVTLTTPFSYSGQETLLVQLETPALPTPTARVWRDSATQGATVVNFRIWSSSIGSSFRTGARFEIQEGPSISTTDLGVAVETLPYNLTVQADGGTQPFTWSAMGLPPSLSIDPATGEISGTPTIGEAGSYSVDITVTDSANETDTESFTLVVDPAVHLDAMPTLPEGTDTGAFGPIDFSATGGSGTLSWQATGLPSGLTLHPSTGRLSGTLDADASSSSPYTVSVTVHDAAGTSDTDTVSIVVKPAPKVATESLPRAVIGQQYGPATLEATGGVAPLTWSSDELPEGLELEASTGMIGGVLAPTEGTSLTIFVTVTDANGVFDSTELEIQIGTVRTGGSGCGAGASGSAARFGTMVVVLGVLLAAVGVRRRMM